MVRYLHCLQEKGIFKKIQLNFLVVGHTHDLIDQVFSRYSVAMSLKECKTLSEMGQVLKSAYTIKPWKKEIAEKLRKLQAAKENGDFLADGELLIDLATDNRDMDNASNGNINQGFANRQSRIRGVLTDEDEDDLIDELVNIGTDVNNNQGSDEKKTSGNRTFLSIPFRRELDEQQKELNRLPVRTIVAEELLSNSDYKTQVEIVYQVADASLWLSEYFRKLGGISEPHEFIIEKDPTDGYSKLRARHCVPYLNLSFDYTPYINIKKENNSKIPADSDPYWAPCFKMEWKDFKSVFEACRNQPTWKINAHEVEWKKFFQQVETNYQKCCPTCRNFREVNLCVNLTTLTFFLLKQQHFSFYITCTQLLTQVICYSSLLFRCLLFS